MLRTPLNSIRDLLRSRLSMQLEILALRHQLAVYQRTARRPRVRPTDRILWSWSSRHWSRWREVPIFVRPAVSPVGEGDHCMETTSVPGTLDQAEQMRKSGTAHHSPSGPRSDPENVHRQPSLGILPNSGRIEEPQSLGRSFHRRQGLEGTRDRTGPRPSVQLENLHQVTRCGHRGRRLLHDRGLDGSRPGHARHAVRDRYRHSPGAHCRHDGESKLRLDVPGRSKPHGLRGRPPQGKAAPDRRP